jgi:hypothetical protein
MCNQAHILQLHDDRVAKDTDGAEDDGQRPMAEMQSAGARHSHIDAPSRAIVVKTLTSGPRTEIPEATVPTPPDRAKRIESGLVRIPLSPSRGWLLAALRGRPRLSRCRSSLADRGQDRVACRYLAELSQHTVLHIGQKL